MSQDTPLCSDWTKGRPGLAFQACRPCGHRWLFARSFCPKCGSMDVETHPASGRGTVHAATLVTRAPSEELRAHTPYCIVLVDAEEGFRLMAHATPGIAIGDQVTATFRPFGPGLVPYFERVE